MLYDLGRAPRPGSLLESLMVIVSRRRLERDYLQSKMLAMASLVSQTEDTKLLQKSMEQYLRSALPYLEAEIDSRKDEEKKTLEKWIGGGPVKLVPLPNPNVADIIRDRLKRENEERAINKMASLKGTRI